MKPWVNTDTKNKSSVGAALWARAFGLWLCICWESAAPLELNKSISMINPGLAPWAMQEYRPCRAHLRFHHHSIVLMRLLLLKKGIVLEVEKKHLSLHVGSLKFGVDG